MRLGARSKQAQYAGATLPRSRQHNAKSMIGHSTKSLLLEVFLLLASIQSGLAAAEQRLFLWRAEATFGEPVYLFGSLHYATSECYPLPAAVQEVYEQSTALALEIDVSDDRLVETANVLGKYSRGAMITRDVPSKSIRRLKRLARTYNWDWNDLSRNRPWVVAGLLAGAEFERAGYSREFGTDVHFARLAKGDGKPIVALESIEEQFDAFNSLSKKTQVFLLQDTMDAMPTGENVATLVGMIHAWRLGDGDKMAELVEGSMQKSSHSSDALPRIYHERNRRMAYQIERYVRDGARLFVVVGVGHLVGRESLPAMLRASGFEVDQVVVTPPIVDANPMEGDTSRQPASGTMSH